MTRVLYEVSARIPNPAVAEAWAAWILREHIAEVIQAGAMSGRLIQDDEDAARYTVQYEFADREALETYLAEEAPRLRDAGLRRFGASQVAYTRRSGRILSP